MNIFTSMDPTATPVPTAPPPMEDAPPPYETLQRTPSQPGAPGLPVPQWQPQLSNVPGTPYNPRGFKLLYMDFVPQLARKRTFKSDEYESFSTLVQRANSWLEEHSGLQLISCETLTWMGRNKKNIYPENSLHSKCFNQGTLFLRGLRLWYMMDTIPSPHRPKANANVIVCRTLVPFRKESRFEQLVSTANENLQSKRIGGKILSVESIRLTLPGNEYKPRYVNPDLCYWKEDPSEAKTCVTALRLYALLGPDEQLETLGFQDFVPDKNRRSKENKGYEVYSDVVMRATQWIVTQQGVRFTDLQTVSVKIKKKVAFEERCVFTEHGSSTSNWGGRETNYLSIVRAFFVIPQASGSRPEFPPVRLTQRTFVPAQISVATSKAPARYEEVRVVVDRINQWLQITGARVFSIETVPLRSVNPGAPTLGSEATYSKNQASTSNEFWLYHIRLYIDGEYSEPPGALSLVVPSVARVQMIGV